jgi:alpha-D-ribose 1-methylphosphonate 5-triphosphate synthase subunit PhnH
MTTASGTAFANPVLATQSTFRAIMEATARPGKIRRIEGIASAPRPLSAAAAAVALTLLDHDTPVWLDPGLAATPAVADWLRFHAGAPIVSDSNKSAFALVCDPRRLPALDAFHLGTPEYPDRSTTIIVQAETLMDGRLLVLSGPGIDGRRHLRAAPLPDDMAERLIANRTLFPRGIDLLLVTDREVAALPRSVRIERE